MCARESYEAHVVLELSTTFFFGTAGLLHLLLLLPSRLLELPPLLFFLAME